MSKQHDRNARVNVIWTRDGMPNQLNGRVVQRDDELLEMRPDQGVRPEPGARCVVCVDAPERIKITARVRDSSEEIILLELGRSHHSRRYYPRVDTVESFMYRLAEPVAVAGLTPAQISLLRGWCAPATHHMNLSIDGLAFLSDIVLPMGARVQVKLRLSTDPGQDHLVEGEVVRSSPEDGWERELPHRVALHLSAMSPETHQALLEYVLHCQQQDLEHLEPRGERSVSTELMATMT